LTYMNVIKVALLAFIGGGAAPKVAVEFGRRVIPVNMKPTFLDMEETFRVAKK
jgi:chemotaxis protein MotA